jgi:hypothetical protein
MKTGGGPLSANKPRHWEVNGDVLTLTTRDDSGAPSSVSRWKKVVKKRGAAVTTAKMILIVLLLGVPAWLGAQATTRPAQPELFTALPRKNAKGAVSGTLECGCGVSRRSSIASRWKRIEAERLHRVPHGHSQRS